MIAASSCNFYKLFGYVKKSWEPPNTQHTNEKMKKSYIFDWQVRKKNGFSP